MLEPQGPLFMRIIFCDIDGTLNNRLARMQPHDPDAPVIDPDCVEPLNKIVASVPDAKVVLTSSMRMWVSLSDLQAALKSNRLEAEVIDVTPLLCVQRGGEIKAWLDVHPEVEGFVIFDDDKTPGEFEPYTSRLVSVDPVAGLTDAAVKPAVECLMRARG